MHRYDDQAPALCVLASGSSGNCSVLRSIDGKLVLIDAGLSPKRTAQALERVGCALQDVAAIVVTHLDHDHFYASWSSAIRRRLPPDARLWVHVSHAGERSLAPLHEAGRVETFSDQPFEPVDATIFTSKMARHDAEGVATFRVSMTTGELGYLTDLGDVPESLVNFHRGVGVLAIESNYCPRLQIRSERPDFLKRRIMGGAGHLSNEQCLAATETISPASHAVFLHLSRECNSPEIVGDLHEGANYARTIAAPDQPTRWVRIEGRQPTPATPRVQAMQSTLFEQLR